MGRRVVLAPDKFKGGLTSAEVADALAEGITGADPGIEVRRLPVADGGDGMIDAFLALGYAERVAECCGPDGRLVEARYAVRGDAAVVELAECCGLWRYAGPIDGWAASSFGFGEVIARAVRGGARRLILGIGGSASTDAGAGMLQALGAHVLDAEGRPLPPGVPVLGGGPFDSLRSLRERDEEGSLKERAVVDLGPARELLAGVRITAACDVDNPLLGDAGAARVFGPQKGLSPQQIADADRALAAWADLFEHDRRHEPGAGAAGGVGFALRQLDAELVSGIDLVLRAAGAEEAIRGADLVVTGEGRFDAQTLQGKAPHGVARLATRLGVPVEIVCGSRDLSDAEAHAAGVRAVHQLLDLEPDLERCLAEPRPLLVEIGRRLATGLIR